MFHDVFSSRKSSLALRQMTVDFTEIIDFGCRSKAAPDITLY